MPNIVTMVSNQMSLLKQIVTYSQINGFLQLSGYNALWLVKSHDMTFNCGAMVENIVITPL